MDTVARGDLRIVRPAPSLDELSTQDLDPAGRDDRRMLAGFDARQAELESAAEHRAAWFAEHAETLRDELATQVAARRVALGLNAALAQPDHLVELLGPLPDDAVARTTWTRMAGRVEAYREQWGVEPDELRESPIDGVQYREWSAAVHTVEVLSRLDAPHLERGLELGRYGAVRAVSQGVLGSRSVQNRVSASA